MTLLGRCRSCHNDRRLLNSSHGGHVVDWHYVLDADGREAPCHGAEKAPKYGSVRHAE